MGKRSFQELLKRGGLFGAGAFVAGFVLTYFLEGGRFDSDSTTLFELEGESFTMGDFNEEETVPETWELVTWLYHSAHGTNLKLSFAELDVTMLVSMADVDGLPIVIPPVVLLASGYLLVDSFGAETTADAAKRGTAIVSGYFPAALLSAYVSTYTITEGGESLEVGVATTDAVLYTGLVYPVVLGAVGGYLALEIGDANGDPGADRSSGRQHEYHDPATHATEPDRHDRHREADDRSPPQDDRGHEPGSERNEERTEPPEQNVGGSER